MRLPEYYGDVSTFVYSSYIMYSKDSMPLFGFDGCTIVDFDTMKVHYTDMYPRMDNLLYFVERDIQQNLHDIKLYYVNLSGCSYDRIMSHNLDCGSQTFYDFLDYLRTNLSADKSVCIVPLMNYDKNASRVANKIENYRQNKKNIYINLGAYKNDANTVRELYYDYFNEASCDDRIVTNCEFIISNDELLGVGEYIDRYY